MGGRTHTSSVAEIALVEARLVSGLSGPDVSTLLHFIGRDSTVVLCSSSPNWEGSDDPIAVRLAPQVLCNNWRLIEQSALQFASSCAGGVGCRPRRLAASGSRGGTCGSTRS